MIRNLTCTVLICIALCWHIGSFAAEPQPDHPVQPGIALPARAQEAPRMQLSEITFDFKEVMEGSVVSHDFIVWNTGNAVLRIEQVGPTCGCLKTDFDESVPPGGAGRITLIVDCADHEGLLERDAATKAPSKVEVRLYNSKQQTLVTRKKLSAS